MAKNSTIAAQLHAPRKDNMIHYKGEAVGTVTHVDGNLCWHTNRDGEPSPFIWRFCAGELNNLHYWPGKPLEADKE